MTMTNTKTYTLEDAPCARLNADKVDEYIKNMLRDALSKREAGEKISPTLYKHLDDIGDSIDTEKRDGITYHVSYEVRPDVVTLAPLPLAGLFSFDVVIREADEEGNFGFEVYRHLKRKEGEDGASKLGYIALFPTFGLRCDRDDEFVQNALEEPMTMSEALGDRLGYNARIRDNERIIRKWLVEASKGVSNHG